MDDITLREMFHQDEAQWYALLIDRYTPYVTAIISGMAKGTLSSCDIEEVAADVFFKIWVNRTHICFDSLKAFIAQISRNATIDRLRKTGHPTVSYDDDVLQLAFHERPDEVTIQREQRQIIHQAVNSLGEPDREVFIRYYYFGETVKAISVELRLNASTIKTKLHRLRGKLRSIMMERGYGCE